MALRALSQKYINRIIGRKRLILLRRSCKRCKRYIRNRLEVPGLISSILVLGVVMWLEGAFGEYLRSLFATDRFTNFSDFEIAKNSSFPMEFATATMNHSIEMCHALCSEDKRCKLFVVSLLEAETNCAHFNATPYGFGATVFFKEWSATYLKTSKIKGEKADGLLYFLGHRPMTLDESAKYCEKHSDFYHLAILTPYIIDTNTLNKFLDSREEISAGLSSSEDLPGVYVQMINLNGPTVEALLRLDEVLNQFKSHEDGIGTLHSVYLLGYSAGRWSPVLNSSIKGYPLCQGDPWNTKELHDIYRRVAEKEKLNRLQAVQKYLREIGDHIIYRRD